MGLRQHIQCIQHIHDSFSRLETNHAHTHLFPTGELISRTYRRGERSLPPLPESLPSARDKRPPYNVLLALLRRFCFSQRVALVPRVAHILHCTLLTPPTTSSRSSMVWGNFGKTTPRRISFPMHGWMYLVVNKLPTIALIYDDSVLNTRDLRRKRSLPGYE